MRFDQVILPKTVYIGSRTFGRMDILSLYEQLDVLGVI